MDGIELKIDEEVYDYIVDKAVEFKLGARGLRSICEAILIDAMYESPSPKGKSKVHITFKYAQNQLNKNNVARLKVA